MLTFYYLLFLMNLKANHYIFCRFISRFSKQAWRESESLETKMFSHPYLCGWKGQPIYPAGVESDRFTGPKVHSLLHINKATCPYSQRFVFIYIVYVYIVTVYLPNNLHCLCIHSYSLFA